MKSFDFIRATDLGEAIAALTEHPDAKLLAGGTNLVDLMKYDVETPSAVIDINRLPLAEITDTEDGGLSIGTLVTNAALAYDARVEHAYPLLAKAILSGASPQLRNAATTGGNLLQRTRCYYFYDPSTRCNKREPGSGCSAIGGVNRIHAILGASEHCIAVHPSDMCVALAALDATVEVAGPQGERSIPFLDFHRLPGDRPQEDNTLSRDEIVTGVRLPKARFGQNVTYLKVRDRQSYAFALVSVAAAIAMEGDSITDLRLALGGVAHKPWRRPEVEKAFVGQGATDATFGQIADRLLEGAAGQGDNDFKIPLARATIIRALQQARAGTPQVPSQKSLN